MGTRGLWGIRKNNVDKAAYNHFDSYPEGLGNEIVTWLKNTNKRELKTLFNVIDFESDSDIRDSTIWPCNWILILAAPKVCFGAAFYGCHCKHSAGTGELGHLEMIGAIVYQLTRNLSLEEIKKSGFDTYFVDHTTGIYPTAASGFPWTAASMQSKGDVITDLHEDLAAEQKARTTYDNILRLSDDPDVNDVIKFLRQREVVHFQRFGEAVELLRQKLDQKNVYYMNPAFDI